MNTENLLRQIFQPGKTLLYRLTNPAGKSWLMPARNMRTAFNLYQPSSWKGRLMRQFFPVLHRSAAVRAVIGASAEHMEMKPEFRTLLESIFGITGIEFAIFTGTPCAHQKITIQLSRGTKILGYCKITDNSQVSELFRNEAELLSAFEKAGIGNVPRSLYFGELGSGTFLFIQSTCKTNNSRIEHSWTALHSEFLEQLELATKRELVFEESDYCRTLTALKEKLNWLPDETSKQTVSRALEAVMSEFAGKLCEFSAYHADFTPWNTFIEKGELFVFDWEYANLTYPPGLDRYHFFTQTAIFEQHLSGERIAELAKKQNWLQPNEYRLYLLDIIARFSLRADSELSGDDALTMRIWVSLLNSFSCHA